MGKEKESNNNKMACMEASFNEKLAETENTFIKKLEDLGKDLHGLKTLHGSTLTKLNESCDKVQELNQKVALLEHDNGMLYNGLIHVLSSTTGLPGLQGWAVI
ncbi:MAG: hypothetical protein AAF438_19990 [Pseudomonadota bacterium]